MSGESCARSKGSEMAVQLAKKKKKKKFVFNQMKNISNLFENVQIFTEREIQMFIVSHNDCFAAIILKRTVAEERK